jgi:hypothetical protein
MGRFIRLDQLSYLDDDWILPGYLQRYDQRHKPWPNDLFPYDVVVYDFPIQGLAKILIRRCIEQECRGDVAIEKSYDPARLTWHLWFQFDSDQALVTNLVETLIRNQKANNG